VIHPNQYLYKATGVPLFYKAVRVGILMKITLSTPGANRVSVLRTAKFYVLSSFFATEHLSSLTVRAHTKMHLHESVHFLAKLQGGVE
jgi:hypothetical protein